MATTYTLSDTITRPNGMGYQDKVYVRLVNASNEQINGFYDAGVIVEPARFSSDSEGVWSIDLIANTDITPASSYYAVKIGPYPSVFVDMTQDGTIGDNLVTP